MNYSFEKINILTGSIVRYRLAFHLLDIIKLVRPEIPDKVTCWVLIIHLCNFSFSKYRHSRMKYMTARAGCLLLGLTWLLTTAYWITSGWLQTLWSVQMTKVGPFNAENFWSLLAKKV